MLDIRETSDGTIVPIKVSAGSRVAGLRGVQDGALKVSVTVAPEKGKANQAIVKLLAKELSVSKSNVEIISGHTSNQKQVLIKGIDRNSLLERFAKLL